MFVSCFQGILASAESLCLQLYQAAYLSLVKAVGSCFCLPIVYGGTRLQYVPSVRALKPGVIAGELSYGCGKKA